MIVYALKEGTIIWSDNNSTHKAGRVPLHAPLRIHGDNASWYAIERPSTLSLPPQDGYPDYWVKKSDICLLLPKEPVISELDPEAILDAEIVIVISTAIAMILKWFKQ